jgi:restriction system protein
VIAYLRSTGHPCTPVDRPGRTDGKGCATAQRVAADTGEGFEHLIQTEARYYMRTQPQDIKITPEPAVIKLSTSDNIIVSIADISSFDEAPSILLQTIIVIGDKTKEGQLIEAVTIPWYDIITMIQRDPNIIYELEWRKLEELVAGAYKRSGFDEVILTPRSRDYGRDIIAVKKGVGEVKAYKPGHLVKADDVRALMGVLHGDSASSKAFLTTTSEFAPEIHIDPFISCFIPGKLELINGKKLLQRLIELAKKTN